MADVEKDDPTLREFLSLWIERIEKIMDERDRLYEERHQTQIAGFNSALSAHKELTQTAFDASEKAIHKAEIAQTIYNEGHNDLSRKMETQAKDFLSRHEATTLLKNQDEKMEHMKIDISSLRESRSEKSGRSTMVQEWIPALLSLLAIAASFYVVMSR